MKSLACLILILSFPVTIGARRNQIKVPPHCVNIYWFEKPGHLDKKTGDIVWDKVHGKIRNLEECWPYKDDIIYVDHGQIQRED